MRRALVTALAISLAGCGVPSSIIRSESISYEEVIEETTNKILLTNVLRARDKAPLHFSEMTKVSETVKQSATVGSKFSLGAFKTPEDNLSPSFTLDMSPNFELSHIYNKEFVTGIASPIDPKFMKYWLDRGLDQRAVLFLFFSSGQIVETDPTGKAVTKIGAWIHNAPRAALDVINARAGPAARCQEKSEFERYMTLVNRIPAFYAVATPTPNTLVADNLDLTRDRVRRTVAMLAKIDPAKYKIKCVEGSGCTQYDIEAIVKETAIELRYFKSPQPTPQGGKGLSALLAQQATLLGPTIQLLLGKEERKKESAKPTQDVPVQFSLKPDDTCRLLEGYVAQQAKTAPIDVDKSVTYELKLQIRSVGEIIQFLGDLVELQEKVHRDKGINNPITLGYCPEGEHPGCDDILFTVTSGESRPRLKLGYRGRDYSIAEYAGGERAGRSGKPVYKDHSIEVLAVLNQLIGLHRSADDVKSTPSVRLIP